ncbi:CPBP family intramembrane metalloprotease [Alicyclobacillus cycloheptanicus]|uniref:Membrane protease YdiL (CAAX protease family) n=1 Tax=Alicyclobacillus cycloheptanicus TaxID=1457 RepID=A0ABT9XKV4_9BACL|nr:CPBP family glutamic-type intramembrane protease [Alicyclobacillus cycloheptanicus]MDQ0190918.1 membrane protease YdiL (CAAX protease family) [Alicyclobacillus cycloheptanicus]WDM02370.1 CPBP family intramembrane metalloprotease [Alicyclobacillus cycloheptanicus]
MLSRRTTTLAAFITAYLLMVYCVYTGPLSTTLPAGYPVLRDLLWNYGVLALFIFVLWFLAKHLPKYEIPKLPAHWTRFLILLFALGLSGFFVVSFWKWIVESPPKTIANIIIVMGKALTHYVSLGVANSALNGVLTIYETLFVLVVVLWQLHGWRRQTFSFSWRHGAATIVLLIISTLVSWVANRFFLHDDPVQTVVPTGRIVSLLATFVCQSLVNGIPEELFYRAYIFPQLLAWIRRPLITGWITIALFNASHIPSLFIGQGLVLPWWKWILWCLFNLQPTGWLYLAIYYRMRSAIPGATYHTYITLWAFPFLM